MAAARGRDADPVHKVRQVPGWADADAAHRGGQRRDAIAVLAARAVCGAGIRGRPPERAADGLRALRGGHADRAVVKLVVFTRRGGKDSN